MLSILTRTAMFNIGKKIIDFINNSCGQAGLVELVLFGN